MVAPPRPQIDREKVKGMIESFDLSPDCIDVLYRKLIQARQDFAVHCWVTWAEKVSIKAKLKQISSRVTKISSLISPLAHGKKGADTRKMAAEERLREFLLNRMGQAGEHWAWCQQEPSTRNWRAALERECVAQKRLDQAQTPSDQKTAGREVREAREDRNKARDAYIKVSGELLNLGFNPTTIDDAISNANSVDYGAYALIIRWVDTLPVISAILAEARQKLSAKKAKAARGQGAKEWLCGEALPRVYEQISARYFSVSKDNKDRVKATGGVQFVILALDAMGLGEISPETVASHWKRGEARRGKTRKAAQDSSGE